MSTIVEEDSYIEEDSYTPTSVSRLVFLIAIPAIALTLMAAYVLRQQSPRSEPASITSASVTVSMTPTSLIPRDHEPLTLYIMNSAYAAQLTELPGRGSLLDWYAYVSTPDEEADLMRLLDHADWIRYESGLPLTRVIDLRGTLAGSTSGHGASHGEE